MNKKTEIRRIETKIYFMVSSIIMGVVFCIFYWWSYSFITTTESKTKNISTPITAFYSNGDKFLVIEGTIINIKTISSINSRFNGNTIVNLKNGEFYVFKNSILEIKNYLTDYSK